MYNPQTNGGNKAVKATMTDHHLKVPTHQSTAAVTGSEELLSTTNHSSIAEEPRISITAAPPSSSQTIPDTSFEILIKEQDRICIDPEPANKDQVKNNTKKKRLKGKVFLKEKIDGT